MGERPLPGDLVLLLLLDLPRDSDSVLDLRSVNPGEDKADGEELDDEPEEDDELDDTRLAFLCLCLRLCFFFLDLDL